MMDFDKMSRAISKSGELERELFGDEHGHFEYPWLSLPTGYSFQVIFPFCGAASRFCVRKDSNPDHGVSVYLDVASVLGSVDEPYWEIYPAWDGDTERFLLNETDELVRAIVASLDSEEER